MKKIKCKSCNNQDIKKKKGNCPYCNSKGYYYICGNIEVEK